MTNYFTADVQRYQNHLLGLARRNNIRMTQSTIDHTDTDGRQVHHALANPIDRYVDVPFVVDDTSYAVALHEFGHLLAVGGWSKRDHGDLTREDLVQQLKQEKAAWAWARENALDWTVGMEQTCIFTLQSYERALDNWPEIERQQAAAKALKGAIQTILKKLTGMSPEVLHAKMIEAHRAGKTFEQFRDEIMPYPGDTKFMELLGTLPGEDDAEDDPSR